MRRDTDRVPSLFSFRAVRCAPLRARPVMPTLLSGLLLPVAQSAPPAGGGGLFASPLLLMAVLFAIMYFTMIRPQARQAKRHRELVGGLKKGDRVVTAGGLHGTIAQVDDTTVLVRVDGDVKLRVERGRIVHVLGDEAKA